LKLAPQSFIGLRGFFCRQNSIAIPINTEKGKDFSKQKNIARLLYGKRAFSLSKKADF